MSIMNYNIIRRMLLCAAFFTLHSSLLTLSAQDKPFKGVIINKANDVFMRINLYEDDVTIPGQEILGNTYGYIKKNTDSRVWIITGVMVDKKNNKALLEMVNDYGSEDLNAKLSIQPDSTYLLRQLSGSTIKMAGNGKWIKLPKEMKFIKK
jgi:hypothetical protein